MERSFELVIELFGILKAGGAYVPIDPGYPRAHVRSILKDSGISLLITLERFKESLPVNQQQMICVDADWHAIAKESGNSPSIQTFEDNIAYVIHTSGSTGRPKGVMMTYRGICNHLLWMQQTFELTAADRVLQKTPLCFDVSVWELIWPLLYGAKLCLARPSSHQDCLYLIRLIVEQEITVLHFVPSMLAIFLESQGLEQCRSLRQVLCGGEPMSPNLQERFFEKLGSKLNHLYGPTETAIDVTNWSCGPAVNENVVPIGKPIANTKLFILDERLRPVSIGTPGELYIAGSGLARGYLDQPALTSESFVPDPFCATGGGRLYKTGDIVRSLPDGNIVFLGRVDDQVKIRGVRIELGEIEASLSQAPGIREQAVAVREDHLMHKSLVAYYCARENPAPSASDLRLFLQERLPRFMVPSFFVLLDSLPRTPSGKIDRKSLPNPQISKSSGDDRGGRPYARAEKILVDIWTEILNMEQIGLEDEFADLGGDSLLAIRGAAMAHAKGLQIPAKQWSENSTISALANSEVTKQGPLFEQGPVTGTMPMLPTQLAALRTKSLEALSLSSNTDRTIEVPSTLHAAQIEHAVQKVMTHHDALRLRIVACNGSFRQFIVGSDELPPIKHVDLREKAGGDQLVNIVSLSAGTDKYIDLSRGPVAYTILFYLGVDQPYKLAIKINHLVTDEISNNILEEDIEVALKQIEKRIPVELAPKTTSVKRWAEMLVTYANSKSFQREIDYWRNLPWSRIEPLPLDYPENLPYCNINSAAYINLVATMSTCRGMSHAANSSNGNLNQLLLSILAESVRQWSGTSVVMIENIHHGRESISDDIDLSRTVGYFASKVPLVLDLADSVHPEQVLGSVIEQLQRIPNGGIGYGILRCRHDDVSIGENMEIIPEASIDFNSFVSGWRFRESSADRGSKKKDKSCDGWSIECNESINNLPLREAKGQKIEHGLGQKIWIEGERIHVCFEFNKDFFMRASVESLTRIYVETAYRFMNCFG